MTRVCSAFLKYLLCAALCLLLMPSCWAGAADALGSSESLLRGCDVYGNTNTETSFGSVTADAARESCGADIALLPSEDFGNNLQPGAVTEEDLAFCLLNDSPLAVTDLTADRIWEMLEISFSHLQLKDGMIDRESSYFAGYLQTSGLRVRCDAAAPAGSRVLNVTLTDGTVLDPEDDSTTYRVVSTRKLLLGAYGYPAVTEQTLEDAGTEREAVANYFRAQGTVSEPENGRIRIDGTRDWLRDNILKVLLIVVALLFMLGRLSKSKRREDVWRSSRTATADEVEQ